MGKYFYIPKQTDVPWGLESLTVSLVYDPVLLQIKKKNIYFTKAGHYGLNPQFS